MSGSFDQAAPATHSVCRPPSRAVINLMIRVGGFALETAASAAGRVKSGSGGPHLRWKRLICCKIPRLGMRKVAITGPLARSIQRAQRDSRSRWMWRAIVIVTLAAAGCGVAAPCAAFDQLHASLDSILRTHVFHGRVDYRRLVDDPNALRGNVQSLASVTPGELAGLPRDDQLAFWINAYNTFALMSIVQHYPLSRHTIVGLAFPANSIWQVSGVWKERRWRAAGRAVSLDMIEHEIIRPTFREPRIHFALVCAASSCPNLRSEAYRGDRLNTQLEDQVRQFLANPDKGLRLDRDNAQALVSKIFDWYGVDFMQAESSAGGKRVEQR